MPCGKITFYAEDRGVGFCSDDSGAPDIWFHISAMRSAGISQTDVVVGKHFQYNIGENTHTGRRCLINPRLD